MSERNLIGLCLKNRDGFETALTHGVTPESFADPICSSVFSAMRELDAEGATISLASVCRKLGPSLAPDVIAISTTSPTAANVKPFAVEVASSAWVRVAAERLRELSSRLHTRREFEPIDELRAMLERLPDLQIVSGESGPKRIGEVLPEWLTDLEERLVGKVSSNITTGFQMFDLVFNGGWHRGAFYVVAARPGRGKTTFALSSAIEASLAGFKTLVATVEMSAKDIATKTVSNLARVRTGAFVSATLTEDETDRTMGQMQRIADLPLWIDEAWRGDFEKFVAHCRRLKRRAGLDVVFLDYIGLTKMRGRFDSRREEVVAISTACKWLAGELDIAVVALAQLNRNAEDATIPGKEHIAESDNLGRDPDGVLLLYRTKGEDEDGNATNQETRVSIAKNRWGREVDIPIDADLAFSAFRNVNLNAEALK